MNSYTLKIRRIHSNQSLAWTLLQNGVAIGTGNSPFLGESNAQQEEQLFHAYADARELYKHEEEATLDIDFDLRMEGEI